MGQARGTISKEDLEKYGGANVILLDGTNDVFSSSGSAGGVLNWGVNWDSGGFSGSGWNFLGGSAADGETWQYKYQQGSLESYLNSNSSEGYALMQDLVAGRHYSCYSV